MRNMTVSRIGPKIGFIGLGLMGKAMAQNLARNGVHLTVFNRRKRPAEDLREMGATVAASPKVLAQNSEVIIDMVTDAPDVQEVLLGENGVIHGAKPGTIVVDMSTNSPDTAEKVERELSQKGIRFLDAPVSGGDKGAREATLVIMVGGDKSVFEECVPVFEFMGKQIVYMGPTGAGQATKLCNQVAVSLHTLATSEALLLGTACGLNGTDLLKVLTSGAANSWNLANLGPKILARDFEPGFKVAHLQKDLRYVIELAGKYNLSLFGAAIANQLFSAVLAENAGEKGTQALAQMLEKLSNRQIS